MEALVGPTLERWFSPAAPESQARAKARIGNMIRTTSVEGFAACAGALQQLDLLPGMRHITAPTLLVAGSQDATMPADMRHIQTLIRNASFVEIDAAGHLPNVEQAEAFNETLGAFLRQQAVVQH
jgi:3-oxoadipate enol-lactonase